MIILELFDVTSHQFFFFHGIIMSASYRDRSFCLIVKLHDVLSQVQFMKISVDVEAENKR